MAMLSGLASTTKDVPPFILQQGHNCVTGLNIVGLRRSGMPATSIDALRVSFRILFKEGRTQASALERIEADLGSIPEVAEFIDFIRASLIGISPAREVDKVRRSG